jgi:2',3'-cyclic-nucleotide 2'-phosphodiesterase/3'-nucleotidase
MRFIGLWLILLVSAAAREVPVTILHTTDLHGNLLPATDYNGTTNVGGLARCATVIRQVRAQEKNVLLLDAGDTIQGTAASWLADGQVMVRALNHLRYDAWVLGNHEFDWGLGKLTGCVARAQMPVLAANIKGMAKVEPFVIREVDGVKVAIVGLTTPGIPTWSRPRLIPGLEFADSVETMRGLLAAVKRAGAQVIVLVVHQGFKEGGDDHANQVIALARRFPEVDVIIGAHTHREMPEFKVGGVLYTQAGYHGCWLGRVDLVFDTEQRRVTRHEAKTIRLDESVAVDAELVKLVGADLARAERHLAEVVGEATGEFTAKGAPKRESAVHELLCAAIADGLSRQGVKVDAVLHGVLNAKATLPSGPVTVGGLWELVPYENSIGVARLTSVQLREILDENAGAYEKTEFRGLWGLTSEIKPSAPAGERVLALGWPAGRERVAVAFNSYDLASGGLRWRKLREIVDAPEAGLVEYALTTREALVDYWRRQGKIRPQTRDWWRVVGGTATANLKPD